MADEREKRLERRIFQLQRELNSATRIAREAKRGGEVLAADRDRYREQVESYERVRTASAIDSGEPTRDELRIAELEEALAHRDRALEMMAQEHAIYRATQGDDTRDPSMIVMAALKAAEEDGDE
jgi:hypothetical protein